MDQECSWSVHQYVLRVTRSNRSQWAKNRHFRCCFWAWFDGPVIDRACSKVVFLMYFSRKTPFLKHNKRFSKDTLQAVNGFSWCIVKVEQRSHPMKTEYEADIKCRPDGSIDTAYYMNIGRKTRSQQAHKMVWHASIVPFSSIVGILGSDVRSIFSWPNKKLRSTWLQLCGHISGGKHFRFWRSKKLSNFNLQVAPFSHFSRRNC